MPAVADVPAPAAAACSDDAQCRLDAMGRRLDEMAAQLRAERTARERWAELAHELMPVAQGAMQLACDELEDLSRDVTVDDAVRFARTAARSLPALERMLAQLGSASELAREVTTLSGAGMALRHTGAATDRIAMRINRIHARRADPAPSAFALLRRLRDPQVRQGLAVTIELLSAFGDLETGVPAGNTDPTADPTKE